MAATDITPEELRRAWEGMRARRSLRHWPATFEEAMADHVRARCIRIEATAAARRLRHWPATTWIGVDFARSPDQTSYWRPPAKATTTHQVDLKRAAAGDRDD